MEAEEPSPLYDACENNDIVKVKELLKNEETDVNQLVNSQTPLMMVCALGHIEI